MYHFTRSSIGGLIPNLQGDGVGGGGGWGRVGKSSYV